MDPFEFWTKLSLVLNKGIALGIVTLPIYKQEAHELLLLSWDIYI
jgi:hypothetical protein